MKHSARSPSRADGRLIVYEVSEEERDRISHYAADDEPSAGEIIIPSARVRARRDVQDALDQVH
jgi:hypothetical protein